MLGSVCPFASAESRIEIWEIAMTNAIEIIRVQYQKKWAIDKEEIAAYAPEMCRRVRTACSTYMRALRKDPSSVWAADLKIKLEKT